MEDAPELFKSRGHSQECFARQIPTTHGLFHSSFILKLSPTIDMYIQRTEPIGYRGSWLSEFAVLKENFRLNRLGEFPNDWHANRTIC